jgi:hypothetical protein
LYIEKQIKETKLPVIILTKRKEREKIQIIRKSYGGQTKSYFVINIHRFIFCQGY